MISVASRTKHQSDHHAIQVAMKVIRQDPIVWVLLIGLTVHTFVFMVLFGVLGVPGSIVTALSTWKEVLATIAATATGVIACRRLLAHRIRELTALSLRNVLPEILVGAFALWMVLRTLWGFVAGSELPLKAQLYGVRFYAIPLLMFLFGRLRPLNFVRLRHLYWGFAIVGGITGALAIVERLIPDNTFMNILGLVGYRNYYYNLIHFYLAGPDQTAASMWVNYGNQYLRRAGSIYMVSKPFAITYLIILPVIVALLHSTQGIVARRWLFILLALSSAGVMLTLTREVIVVCAFLVLLTSLLLRSWKPVGLLVAGAALALVVLITTPTFQLAIESTVFHHTPPATSTLQSQPSRPPSGTYTTPSDQVDSSTAEHLQVWKQALAVSLQNPIIGWGVGTGNEDSQRFVNRKTVHVTLGTENLFLQVFEELGLIGVGLYLCVFSALIAVGIGLFRSGNREMAILGLIVATATLGAALEGITTPLWSGIPLVTFFFWYLAGQALHSSQRAPVDSSDAVLS